MKKEIMKKKYVKPTINVVKVEGEGQLLSDSNVGFKPGVVPPTGEDGGEIEFGSKETSSFDPRTTWDE